MIRIISYNLWHSKADAELVGLVTADPDLDALCLQEVYRTGVPERIGHLRLAHHTGRNLLGLAVYANAERYEVLQTEAFELKKSLHDVVFERTPERLVGTHLKNRETGQEVVLASFHAAPLTALNSLRRKQIATAHELLTDLGDGAPVLMVGDYNYPLFHNRLGERLGRSGYDLVLSDKRTYRAFKLVRGHFDFVTSYGMEIVDVQTLRRGRSDHLPILVTAKVNAEAQAA